MGENKTFDRLGAVIVETRSLPDLVDTIKGHMRFLPGWGLTIFCYENETILKINFPEARIINIGCHINEKHYNFLLTNKLFWQTLEYDKVLIFQHDSMILREGIEEFLAWDFTGAPWKFPPYVGNGGLSLRSKRAMIDTIESIPYSPYLHGNEDVYFCNHLKGKLAPLEVAEKFSCESIYKLGTFGVHAIEKHLTADQVLKIKNQYK